MLLSNSDLVIHAGWIGSICLALCGIPQAVDSILRGNSAGINAGFLVLWFLGELLTLAYVWPRGDVPLIINYSINLFCLLIIGRYRFWPRAGNRNAIRRIK